MGGRQSSISRASSPGEMRSMEPHILDIREADRNCYHLRNPGHGISQEAYEETRERNTICSCRISSGEH